MKIIETDGFQKNLEQLPKNLITVYRKQKKIFSLNWRDSRLHTKKLKGSEDYSFRITRNYRVIFYFYEDETVVFASIGHRKDIYEQIAWITTKFLG